MRYAIIEGGVVTNVCIADAPLPGLQMVASEEAKIGWLYQNGQFVVPPTPPSRPPIAVTRRQLRLWLVRNGYTLAQVEALIDALPEPQRTEARIEWQDATLFERNHPLLRQLAGALLRRQGADLDAALDQAFRSANTY